VSGGDILRGRREQDDQRKEVMRRSRDIIRRIVMASIDMVRHLSLLIGLTHSL
jgi:hypothetical protein